MTPPVVAGAAVTGPALISLAYGDEFAGAGDVLLVLLGPLLVMPLITTSEALLFAHGAAAVPPRRRADRHRGRRRRSRCC